MPDANTDIDNALTLLYSALGEVEVLVHTLDACHNQYTPAPVDMQTEIDSLHSAIQYLKNTQASLETALSVIRR
jgi:hypothetical protein